MPLLHDIAGMTDAEPDDMGIHWRYEVTGCDVTDALSRFMVAERELREVMATEATKAREQPGKVTSRRSEARLSEVIL